MRKKTIFSAGNNKLRKSLRKEPKMAYKKPQMVAKASAKKSYVAGCPTNTACPTPCGFGNSNCLIAPVR